MRSGRRLPRYAAYMLRLWEVQSHKSDRPATWRFSLEDPHTGQRRAFMDLEQLITFLRSETEQQGSGS